MIRKKQNNKLKKESDSMEILELLQWENEHKGTTYYEEGEDFEECEKN